MKLYKSVNVNQTGDHIVVDSLLDKSLTIFNLAIAAEKKNAGGFEVNLTDGINRITLYSSTVNDSQVNIVIDNLKYEGWANAWLELVSINMTEVFLMVGYNRNKQIYTFDEWERLD
jgi:hypothetical protein